MIRGVRAYDLTADLNPPVRSGPGLLGGDAAHTPDRSLFDKRESILHGQQIGSIPA